MGFNSSSARAEYTTISLANAGAAVAITNAAITSFFIIDPSMSNVMKQ